jgi:hypothetical protein
MTRPTILATLVTAVVAIGCGSSARPPAVVAGEPVVSFGAADPLSLGTVTVGDLVDVVLVVSNVGAGNLVLGPLASAALAAPFERTGGTCASGATVSSGAACTVAIRFAPPRAGTFTAQVRVDYSGGSGGARIAALTVAATGLLDCTRTAALQAGFDQGVADGENANSTIAAAGTAAGAALTYTDGRTDGYHDGYVSTYQTAYDTQYATSYAQAYDYWRLQGSYDPASCASGTAAGTASGDVDGRADGGKDGYRAGYDAAYAESYVTGYAAGEVRAAASCATSGAAGAATLAPVSASARAASEPTLDPASVQSCHDRGLALTANPTLAYATAFAAAKAANANYTTGYSDYFPIGILDAVYDGSANGAWAGDRQGKIDGWQVGTAEALLACRQTAYPYAYSAAYPAGYHVGFSAGSAEGAAAGLAAGETRGYADGRALYCPSQVP